MFLEFFKFSTNQRLTLLIMCSLGFAKGFFPLRFPRKSPRPPCFWRPFGAGSYSGICRAICAKRGREFFGCKQGKGVYLLTAAGGWEFFGCGRGEGVLLPTAVGGWIFLVANRAKVSFYLPPRDRSRKTPTPREGWAVMGDCGRIIGAKRILYERNVGGLNNLILAQEEQ